MVEREKERERERECVCERERERWGAIKLILRSAKFCFFPVTDANKYPKLVLGDFFSKWLKKKRGGRNVKKGGDGHFPE